MGREEHRELNRHADHAGGARMSGEDAGLGRSKRFVIVVVVSVLASVYLLRFLSYPVFVGLIGDDGVPISRGPFLTRLLLPELWLGEVTGGGQMPVGIVDRVPIALGVFAWLSVAFGIGQAFVRRAFTDLTRVEAVALAMLVGLAMLSTMVLLVGLAGGSSSRWAIGGPVLGALIVAWLASVRVKANFNAVGTERVLWLPEGIVASGVFGQLASRVVVVLTIGLLTIYGLGAMMPPYEFDVVEYHLQGPKEFFQTGAIGFNDHNIYLNMPLGLEMHSLAAMSLVNGSDGWWLGGLIGKTIIGLHAFLAAALLGGFVARKTNSSWCGWSAAGLWLAVPGNAHVATTGLIDAAMGTYILASAVGLSELYVVRKSLRDPQSDRSTWLVFVICIYAGAAAAAKYPGLIYGVLPCLVTIAGIAVMRMRELHENISGQSASWRGEVSERKNWFVGRWMMAVVGGLSLTCGPWYAKNAVLAGNPVYPLAFEWFGGVGMDANRAEQWAQAHRVPIDSQSGSAYSLSALAGSIKDLVVESEFVQPSLIILLVCGLGAGCLRQVGSGRTPYLTAVLWMWVAWSMWIVLVWWSATHRIDRFWLPAVSLWGAIAGFGLLWLSQRVSHVLATLLVLFGLSYGLVVNSSPVIGDNRFFATLEALRDDGGVEGRAGRVNRSLAWCNANLSALESKLLLIGEARVFDFRMPVLYSTCFDSSPAESWLRGTDGPIELNEARASLRRAGVTHVLVNWSELERYRSPGNYGFSDWPTRDDFAKLAEVGLLKRVNWPISSETADLYAVDLN